MKKSPNIERRLSVFINLVNPNNMKYNKLDLLGRRFGALTVIKETHLRKQSDVLWECQCDCGNIVLKRATGLKRSIFISCGCHHSSSARFHSNVVVGDSCWIWTAKILPNGYGVFNVKGKQVYVHRFSYQLYNGTIPYGLLVCHTCDNRSCVNPAHLWLGTHKDNTQDMISKNRRFPANKCRGDGP